MKKTLGAAVAAFALAGALALTGCSGDSSAIEKAINDDMAPITNVGKTGAAGLEGEVALDFAADFGMDEASLIGKCLTGATVKAENIKVDGTSATADVVITCKDVDAVASLLDSKGQELRDSGNFRDMMRDERNVRAQSDLEESLAATGFATHTVSVTLEKSGSAWALKTGLLAAAEKEIFGDATTKAMSEAFSKYAWKYDGMNASQIVEALKAGGQPIGEIETYDEATDPNNKLGRPGCYTSKTTFWDNRVEDPHNVAHIGGHLSNDMGGTVEVFTNIEDCKSRADYVESITSSTGIGKMYGYRMANAYLRITFDLLPSQAAEYEAEFYQGIK